MTEEKTDPKKDTPTETASSADANQQSSAPESDKPKPKRTPRKRAPRKKSSAKIAATSPADTQAVEKTEPKAEDGNTVTAATPETNQATPNHDSEKPAPKRRPRKRAPRKKSPAKTSSQSTDENQIETTPETKVEVSKTESPSRRKAPAKKSPDTSPAAKEPDKIAYKLLINADEPEECRIALLENGKVESFNVETVVQAQSKGNIYKGIISAIEPNLQAAFVDMGTGKNGFLAFGDIHPEYYCKDVGNNPNWKSLNIQDVVMKGQEVLVEVVKDATGNKGANITTYLSMPGRYIVLMPGSDSHGISRQILDEERRAKLREIIESAKLPEEIGYIIRTASEDVTKAALMQDITYQLNLWNDIKEKGQIMKAPALVYKEQDVVSRFLRDHYTPDIEEILVDNEEVFAKINDFMQLLPARQRKTKVQLHKGSKPIFNQYQVEEQIEQMYLPTVSLPSGGSIVINPTEALVAIDVNSGRTSKDKNFEKTIFLANMEAADELARQLRLRDLGGLIVVDFIDMRDKKNIREVEKRLNNAMKKDKAKVDTSRISKFGLMQISRQRLGPPIQKGNYIICEHCQGHGMVKSVETTALALMRRIQTAAVKRHITAIHCDLPLKVAQYLLNQKRAEIAELEQRYKVEIRITANPAFTPAQGDLKFIKSS
ncbi:MAG: Rne/Rng family ribonuclease [Proteobacteria bacterium]|nr:Rne/Rng family ribonuclease [Pseudomonadota bacterium]MBU1638912.1 Rne/Rng family ribonuclease [Pseudomonadota bacterium]